MATLSEQPALQSTQTEETKDGKRIRDIYAVTFTQGDSVKTWEAQVAPGVPRIGDRHPSDNALGAIRISTSPRARDDSMPAFLVEVEYEPNQFGAGQLDDSSGGASVQGESAGNPPAFRTDGIPRTVPIQKDVNGNAITNSVGDPPVPAAEDEEYYELIEIYAQVPFDVWEKIKSSEWRNTINSKPLLGYKVGECKLVGLSSSSVVVNVGGIPQTFVNITLSWHVDDSWRLDLLDAGFFKADVQGQFNFVSGTVFVVSEGLGISIVTQATLVESTENKERIRDEYGNAYTEPVLLDGRGQPLDGNKQPVTMSWQVKKAKDHNALLKALGLPLTLNEIAQLPKGA